jgi:von Willebrand factor type A domain/Regulator of chromosome condensation (RCC1) repeat/Putative Ig domain
MSTSVSHSKAGNSSRIVRESHPVKFTSLAIAAMLACFLGMESSQAAGTVVAWGDNSRSQTNVPPGLTNVVAVSGGSLHSLALGLTGKVIGWGDSSHGETPAPSGLSNVTAIAAGAGFSLALRSNGSVTAWGNQTTLPGGLTNVVAIAASAGNAIVLDRDGVVLPWGAVSSVPANVTNVVAIAAGHTHDLALRGDGAVIGWGDSSQGKTAIPSDLTDAISLAAGRFHSLALRSDGTVAAWGDNTFNQLAMPPGLTNVVAISAGGVHSLALKGDGTVVAWGDDTYDQLAVPGGLHNVAGIAAGRYHNLAIAGDGSPAITVQPISRYDVNTRAAVFQVMAVGQPPLSYQWQQDGAEIVGATNSVLALANLQRSDAGTYSVIVSNSLGWVQSASTPLPPAWQRPFVLSHSQDQTIPCNEDATFLVEAGGTKPLHYQWRFEGADILGATNPGLVLNQLHPDKAGVYSVVITNVNGAITSQVATLTVNADAPLITSPLAASGKQGVAFNYTITGLHEPTSFSAAGLPFGLSVDATTGNIQGTPVDGGIFNVTMGAATLCGSASTNLTLTIESSIPVITSPLTASGAEQTAFNYQITATEAPVSFGAQALPHGLGVNPVTGIISGRSLYAGEFDATISASNVWGLGTATLHFAITNAPIAGLAIESVTPTYSSPYLLDFQFALTDNTDPTLSHAVVVDPRLLSVTGLEDDIHPTEIEEIIPHVGAKVLKAYLVLDFTESIASLANGDTNSDGISDAVDTEVNGAQSFVNQQPADAQIGVYEFHREDLAPQRVVSLTTDKTLLNNSIAGIWTNSVKNFPAGSRCWDALFAAIGSLGTSNADEQHYVIFVSDGRDESSTTTMDGVIAAANANNVHIYCVGFGDALDAATLQSITAQTSGRYYEATNVSDLTASFAQIGKDLNGQYFLRWATLKRSANAFMPSFQITYQGFTATSPPNPPPFVSGTNILVDTNTEPPTTNIVLLYTTNYIISPYLPTAHAGDVTVGSLRLVADADVHPSGVTLRVTYVPRYIRQIRLHYRANWSCITSLQSTNLGEMLYGWGLTETNDDEGGKWALISSPNPQSLATSIPFASLGKLLTFSFRDLVDGSNAFSVFDVDNTIYTNIGSQSFVFENKNAFIANYPILPYGTPAPWLLQHGFTTGFVAAELSDPDGDGAKTWQEYQAGTDPRNSNSKFIVKSVAQTDSYGRYQITFTTALNRNYRVETSDDLVTWQPLVLDIQGTGDDVIVTDIRNPSETTQAFYRVVVY